MINNTNFITTIANYSNNRTSSNGMLINIHEYIMFIPLCLIIYQYINYFGF